MSRAQFLFTCRILKRLDPEFQLIQPAKTEPDGPAGLIEPEQLALFPEFPNDIYTCKERQSEYDESDPYNE
jgi:hypothetical protein